MAGVDPDDPAHGGLEAAVAVGADVPAGQALSELRRAGASLAVIVDAQDYPQKVVPEKTLAAAPAGQKAAACKPGWPAAAFIQPASGADARRLAAHNQGQPFLGHRTVVVEGGQIAGVVPVPSLIRRPGLTSRVLERLLWDTRHADHPCAVRARVPSLHRKQPPLPSGSP